MKALFALAPQVRQYLLVTGNYWAFTLTDGALRMLVVLHFHALGYSPLQIAALFLFYELFGVITNLVGGYLGARLGLNRTMNIGLGLQVAALLMLTVPVAWLSIPWVMAAQALSGIAKDLNKMSAKKLHQTSGSRWATGQALQVGGDPHRFEERTQGCRLLSWRSFAGMGRFQRRVADHGGGPGVDLDQ
nr:hypothetical protein GCM10020185_63450 [Pseudomonas brassicacearum subsp. brassicacearum]